MVAQFENQINKPLQRYDRLPKNALITYQDLGHLFYPSSQWITVAGGPMEPMILEDLFGWLSDPVRDIKKFTILRQE